MALSQKRIHTSGQTPHAHEREAFDFVVSELPDGDPYHLWAFIDLTDPRGRRYDIDLLIIGYHAIYLVEVKSHPGTLTGDAVDWTFTFPGGGRAVMENPLDTTSHKARVLASLLEKQLARDSKSRGMRAPWVQPLVFLSHEELDVQLRSPGDMHVVTRKNLREAITRGKFPGAPAHKLDRPVNTPQMRATCRAFEALGLRPSVATRKVQDLLLGELLEDGSYYQDHLGVHQSMHDIQRRVRTYVVPASTTAERRDQLHRAARREAQHLTALSDHRGILRLFDYVDTGPMGGPCVIFEHFADALPLDAFLHAHPQLSFDDRIAIIQQLAEALAFCHRKQIVHSALSPRAVLVRRRPPGPGDAFPAGPDAARDPAPIEVRLYNFQLAASADISATSHPTALSSDQTALYLAPEVLESPIHADAVADIFSLGCIAYHVFTGRAPGTNLPERAQLLAGGHLSIAAARDDLAGAPHAGAALQTLDEVVAMATEKNPVLRADSAMEWLGLLLDAATAPAAEPEERHAHPLEAQRGDRLEHGLEVVKVLGTGSTARVLRVCRDGAEYALKVALDPDMDERVRREGQVLARLQAERASHDRIVSLVDELTLGERACLLVTDAGDSLAALISREGPPSLDFARRWGDDLLQALEALEEAGIQHRDIKPANLGVLSRQAKKKRNLRLFDFSLSAAADTAITAGTPAYRDPFLDRRGRWDPAADRWAAAITLHEMCTGARPHWGVAPGQSELPAVATDQEITLAAERFDAAIRSRLVDFFRRALARDVAARFTSAEQMRTEWVACFATASWTAAGAPAADDADDAQPTRPPADLGRIALDTPIEALPLSARARNALDRAGVMTVVDLVRMPQNRLSTTRGIGRATAMEIVHFVQAYRAAHPEHTALTPVAPFFPEYRGPAAAVAFVPGLSSEAATALTNAGLSLTTDVAAAPREQVARLLAAFPGAEQILTDFLGASAQPLPPGAAVAGPPATIDDWLDALLPERGKRPPYVTQVRMLLGLDPVPGATPVIVGMHGHADESLGRASEITTLARHLGKTRAAIHISLTKARKRWQEHPYLADLHAAVAAALDRLGGAASVARVSEILRRAIPPRLSVSADDPARDGDAAMQVERRAVALVRIAAETSGELSQARVHGRLWLARTGLHISLARTLGERADALAVREPLPSSEEVREALAEIVEVTPLAALPPERLVSMAAEASRQAAPSARLELYPRGLSAARAITLSAGALPPGPVTIETLRRVVQARYPEAAPLPERDQLTPLMRAVNLDWSPTEQAYVRPDLAHATSASTNVLSRRDTTHTSHRPAPSPATDEAREFEARLRLAVTRGHFRVLDVTASADGRAADEIARCTGARRVSLEREMLDEAFRLVRELEIDPDVVLAADRDGPAAPDDWANLRTLMKQAATAVIDRVYQTSEPVILTQPGLLARYGLDDVAEHMVSLSRRDDAPAVLLVNPTDGAAAPATIDAAPRPLAVPLSSPAQRMRVPESWLRNLHRGAPP